MRTLTRTVTALSALALLVGYLTGCSRIEPPDKSGQLVVALVPGPTTYQKEDSGEISGFEYDLVNAFAESQGLQPSFVLANDQEEALRLVRQGRAHLAAGVTIDAKSELLYTQPLRNAQAVLVRNADDDDDDAPVATAEKTVAVSGGSGLGALVGKAAGEARKFLVTELSGIPELTLLNQLAERRHILVATDSLLYALAARLHPQLEVAQKLPDKLDFGWAFGPENTALTQKARDYLESLRRDGTLARVHDRYFGYITRVNNQGIVEFIDAVGTDLVRLRKSFQDAQEITSIDWRLLAALAYQESKWDALATSPTGVRGIMMLTEDTADRLRVNNRLDPRQSILAGAKYLADLRDQLPASVPEPDRTWIAMAAYNLGMGHMNGGRAIAEGLGKDPNSWYEMKSVLPLMAKPQYYARLKAGRARGGEAVIMVENIRTYYDILKGIEPPWNSPLRLSQR